MNKYLLNLFKQFNEKMGIATTSFEDPIYLEAFINWIHEQKVSGSMYQQFIDYLGIVINDCDTVELRKGKYDSIALPNTTIISPFASTLKKENKDIVMLQGEPILIGSKIIKMSQVAGTYITQNPYSTEYLSGLEYFQRKSANICIGVYGTIRDKDYESKIRNLSDYGKLYVPDLKEEYETMEDRYFYVLKTENKKE